MSGLRSEAAKRLRDEGRQRAISARRRAGQIEHTTTRSAMFMSETLARDRYLDRLEEAQEGRIARQAAELRRLERVRHRAERRLLRVWQRTDELRATMEVAG